MPSVLGALAQMSNKGASTSRYLGSSPHFYVNSFLFQILSELKSHVERYDPLYLEALFDLITGVAQDIQSDFVKVFHFFFYRYQHILYALPKCV